MTPRRTLAFALAAWMAGGLAAWADPAPAGSLPPGSLPADPPPSGSPPPGSLPAEAPPAGSLPPGSPPAGSPPSGSPPAGSPPAIDTYGQLTDRALQARFERITHELRCLVCQNESIADSNVELASDLRRQVREMLVAGRSDDSIFTFMTDRYGEFVRFRPPLEPKTLLIWGAPFIMLVLGAAIILRIVRQRSRMPMDDEPAPP